MPPMIAPPASRFVKRGGYMICQSCQFEARYCKCGSAPPVDVGAQDGLAADSLKKRIADCKGK
jgi:hypothetical protein